MPVAVSLVGTDHQKPLEDMYAPFAPVWELVTGVNLPSPLT